MSDDPRNWKHFVVWAEEPDVKVVAEPEEGRVSLTIESAIGVNTITIARWRWEHLVAACTLALHPPDPPETKITPPRPGNRRRIRTG